MAKCEELQNAMVQLGCFIEVHVVCTNAERKRAEDSLKILADHINCWCEESNAPVDSILDSVSDSGG